jgi:hypothetical protein
MRQNGERARQDLKRTQIDMIDMIDMIEMIERHGKAEEDQ